MGSDPDNNNNVHTEDNHPVLEQVMLMMMMMMVMMMMVMKLDNDHGDKHDNNNDGNDIKEMIQIDFDL